MSDSDDDYMSLKILNECAKEDVRPSLLFNREKRKHEQYMKKLESMNKRPKTIHEMERENRDKGLSTALPTENKGFQLLQKMGFKPGESLGKTKSGIIEPIDIVLKQGTSGVGRETHLKETINKKQQVKVLHLQNMESQFKLATKEKTSSAQIRKDFFKAQRICEELDFRNKVPDPVQDFFWTKATISQRRKVERQENDSNTDSSDEEINEEFEQYICDENLQKIIDYIRHKHLYCMYCVITGMDEEDLRENCPGPYRLDHDTFDC